MEFKENEIKDKNKDKDNEKNNNASNLTPENPELSNYTVDFSSIEKLNKSY